MKVLLMTSKSGIGFNNAPPIGLYRLKGYLESHGHGCDILDFSLGGQEEALARTAAGEYGIVGMSVSHYHMAGDLEAFWEFRRAAKGRPVLFIAGGQEATYNYEQWLHAGADAVVLGYGEHALLNLARAWEENGRGVPEVFHGIDGLAWRENGGFVFRPRPALTPEEFRDITYDRVLRLDIPFERYWSQIEQKLGDLNFSTSVFISELVRVYTSSHCPNRCGYCSSHRFLSFAQGGKTPIFMLDAAQVFDLVKHYIASCGARGFLFSDDEFLADKGRAREFCRMVAQAKRDGTMDRSVMFNCQARVADFLVRRGGAHRVDLDFIDLLVEAGFHSLGLGVESFSDRLLACPSMCKAGYGRADSLAVIEAMRGRGLTPQVNIILFIPESTPEEVMDSARTGMEIIARGCQTAVTPLLFDIPGAPRHADPAYPVTTASFRNPETGAEIGITGYFIPRDPLVAQAARDIQGRTEAEREAFAHGPGRGHASFPKTALGIFTLAAAARLLGHGETADAWIGALAAMMDARSATAGEDRG